MRYLFHSSLSWQKFDWLEAERKKATLNDFTSIANNVAVAKLIYSFTFRGRNRPAIAACVVTRHWRPYFHTQRWTVSRLSIDHVQLLFDLLCKSTKTIPFSNWPYPEFRMETLFLQFKNIPDWKRKSNNSVHSRFAVVRNAKMFAIFIIDVTTGIG